MCRAAGVAPPDFAEIAGAAVVTFRVTVAAGGVRPGEVTGEVAGEVERLLAAMTGAMKRQEMQTSLGLKHEEHFREAYLVPALRAGLIEMTIPDKPTSRLQKYRLTDKGRARLAARRSP
jgi:ATP-dependent DNA helicase RecG